MVGSTGRLGASMRLEPVAEAGNSSAMRATPSLSLGSAEFNLIRDMVERTYGLVHEQVDSGLLYCGVVERMKLLGMEQASDYCRLLASRSGGEVECRRLIDHITVRETYFFRNPRHLSAIKDAIVPVLARRRAQVSRFGGRPLRVWSAGCSSGEEAYSVAIYLMEAGAESLFTSVQVVGTDISEDALSHARRGIYSSYSLRNADQHLLGKYFTMVSASKKRTSLPQYEVHPSLRRIVTFRYHNLADTPYDPGLGDFDIILCENVLIYFSERTASSVVSAFKDHLRDDGYLFLGFSESSGIARSLFCIARFDQAVAYTKYPSGVHAGSAYSDGLTNPAGRGSVAKDGRVLGGGLRPLIPVTGEQGALGSAVGEGTAGAQTASATPVASVVSAIPVTAATSAALVTPTAPACPASSATPVNPATPATPATPPTRAIAASAVDERAAAESTIEEPKVESEERMVAAIEDAIRLARYDEASELLDDYLAIMPESPALLYVAGQVYANRQEYEVAIRLLRQATRLSLEDVRPRVLLANVYTLCSRLPEAYECLRKAAYIDMDNAEIHWAMANLLVRLDRPEDAVREYRNTLACLELSRADAVSGLSKDALVKACLSRICNSPHG